MGVRWLVRWSVLAIALLVPSIGIAASSPPGPPDKIDPRVLTQATGTNETAVFVILRDKADLSPAFTMKNWNARGQFVVNRLKAVANQSQAGVRGLLASKGKKHQPFWVVNAIWAKVDGATVKELAARSDVESIIADDPVVLPDPTPGQAEPAIDGIEWGVDHINAPSDWSNLGVRGDGIVVANIDTGVLYTHPALVNQYRGNLGGGSFDHNYNWFDGTGVCSGSAPCDNNGHGTHTMGTMVGDDGDPGTNRIGVAPHAKWIAAKGCGTSSCSGASLLSAGQWILAPTKLDGTGADASKRPNIVNNSWGGGRGNSWYSGMVDSWVASGIFPAFSNGNDGPGCNTAADPGDYANTYAAGAFDSSNNIAYFSSRGSSAFGGIKPNIAAPGVNIRSAWNDGGYHTISGTSMASPHVAGTVALMWSANPALIGDIATTRTLLDQTAIDTSDLSCGGTAANNNVWGEGRLDAYAAVSAARADKTPPTSAITLGPATPNGSHGWYTSNVHVTVSASDNTGGTGVAETRCVLDPATAPASFDSMAPGCAYSGTGADVTDEGAHTIYAATIDKAGNKETPISSSFKLDETGPSAALAVTQGTPGSNGWYVSDVTISASGSDSVSSPVTCTPDQYQTSDTDAAGVTFSGSCTNDAGLTTNAAPVNVKLDKTAPVIAVTGFNSGAIFYTGNATPSVGCSTPNDSTPGSGIASSSGPTASGGLNNNGVGSVSYKCSATDVAGNTGSDTRTYNVQYGGVSGILQPIKPDNTSVFSRGQAIPVKFQLAGDGAGTAYPTGFNTGSWTLQGISVSCTSFKPLGPTIGVRSNTTSNSFRYDTTADQYIFNADFSKQAVGSCWKVKATLDDGSTTVAPTTMTSAIFRLQK